MKILFTYLVLTIPFLGLAQDPGVRIRITGDQFEKIYTVRFGAAEAKDIKVKLLDVRGTAVYADSISGVAFIKQYDLSKISNGLYSFKIEYGGTEAYLEDVLLQSKKDLFKQSVVVQKEMNSIRVKVADYNTEPVSVFFLRADGSSAGYDYMDSNIKEKEYALAKFAGASKVEVVQNGEVMVRESL